MKFSAVTALFCLLAPALSAQRMTHRGDEGFATPGLGAPLNFAWDTFPARPAPAVHESEPLKSVSVNELLIPPKAAKELDRSLKAFHVGDIRASNEHLAKAVRIYPDFVEAHYDLGGNYIRLNELDNALAEFQTTLQITPSLPQAHHGLAVSLYLLGRYSEAEAAARRAQELDPELIDYRYMLGRTLVAQGHYTAEAKQLLRQSEQKFPNASLILTQVFMNEGKIDDAAAELEGYLRAPDPANKAKAECFLALLNGTASGTCAAQKSFPDFP